MRDWAFACVWLSFLSAAYSAAEDAIFVAGTSKIAADLPGFLPLAGFNHGPRRVRDYPLPSFTNYTTFMSPGQGFLNPTWVKVLAFNANAQQISPKYTGKDSLNHNETFILVTLDIIGSAGDLNFLIYAAATAKSLSVPFSNIIFSGSHTHSGPGAISADLLWSLAPATDLVVPAVQMKMAESVSAAMIEAINDLRPAKIAIGSSMLTGVTQNRRATISPYVSAGTIDPHLGIIRVDDASTGKPMATVWNYAIHGVCFGDGNMKYSSDIMGGVSDMVEEQVGGIALFMNADAGDIDPQPWVCEGKPAFKGASKFADAIAVTRSSLTPEGTNIKIAGAAHFSAFGPTDLNATLGRFENCTQGGPLDICTLCAAIHCDANTHLYSSWIDQDPHFVGIAFEISGKRSVIATVPGEALIELGWWLRNDTLDIGFDLTLIAGYSNNHMGYFATPNEYDIGGYESELTLWGIKTASLIRENFKKAAAGAWQQLEKSAKPRERSTTSRRALSGTRAGRFRDQILRAGVSVVNGTMPTGTPLAGYNYAPRAVPYWPLPVPREYTTWMEPSQGMWEQNGETFVKAVVVDAGTGSSVDSLCWVTTDTIGSNGHLSRYAYLLAAADGFAVPWEKVTFSASHTHSGPGAIAAQFLWSIAPAEDVVVPLIQRKMARALADAMLQAEASLLPAKMDVGYGKLLGATHNRRSHISPYVTSGTIDPQVGVIAIDDAATGEPLATMYDFAIHGICFDSPNMKFESDVMGAASIWIEQNVGGAALFFNGDAGDINPEFSVSCQHGPLWSGGKVIGAVVKQVRDRLVPTTDVDFVTASHTVDFGETSLNLTLARAINCTRGGPLDLCGICMVLDCTDNIHLPASWIEHTFKFTATRLTVHGKNNLLVSIPGEALVELGWQVYNDTLKLGFDRTILQGYTNQHGGYFATPNEYLVGGYESLLSFWGIDTAEKIRAGCREAAELVVPNSAAFKKLARL